MKRDMDLIRELLLKIESMGPAPIMNTRITGYPEELSDYNLHLLISAGLVEGSSQLANRGRLLLVVKGLTWEGNDLLDAIRAESVWQKTKGFIRERDLQSVPLALIKEVASGIARQMLGLGGGA